MNRDGTPGISFRPSQFVNLYSHLELPEILGPTPLQRRLPLQPDCKIPRTSNHYCLLQLTGRPSDQASLLRNRSITPSHVRLTCHTTN